MSLQVSQIASLVSQDLRSQLSNTGTDQGVLVSFIERCQLDMLRTSNWTFLLSPTKQFITQLGQTNYWIGDSTKLPTGYVDTGLGLTDVKRLNEDSVMDRSNYTQLDRIISAPNDPGLQTPDNAARTSVPLAFTYDENFPYQIQIYPAASNANGYQPVPEPPICTTSVAGALANRFYFVTVTLVDSLGNESSVPSSARVFIPASSVLAVKPPVPGIVTTASGVKYDRYNVYAATASGSEVLQNVSPVSIGSTWTEPTSGLVTNTQSKPSVNKLTTLDGYVIEFRYWTSRPTGLTAGATLIIPDEYKDVIVAGTNWMVAQFLNRQGDVAYWGGMYQTGLRTLIRDRNLSPKMDFVKPDSAGQQKGGNFFPTF